ncbi:MAG TPA: hypothetical protein VLN59_02445 [Burkholderiales bacterium]|nr:hypothetical protein [Burkholderiales bacterium]
MKRFSRPLLEACTQAFEAVLPLGRPADAALSAFFRAHAKIGRRDRATIADSVYAALRHRRRLARLVTAPNPRRLVLAVWAGLLGANLRELEPWLQESEARWIPAAKEAVCAPQAFEVECELPDWVIERLRARFDDGAILALAKGLLQSASLDLRVNPMKMSREAAIERFVAEGLRASATPYSRFGVRLEGRPAINQHPLFLEGGV